MTYTLILDIEGTITIANGTIGLAKDELQKRLQALETQDKQIILCSGRDLAYIHRLKADWGLAYHSPIIAEDGCVNFDGKKEILTFDPTKHDPQIIRDRLIYDNIFEIAEFDPYKQYVITIYPTGFSSGIEYTAKQIQNIFNKVKEYLADFNDTTVTYSSCSVEVLPFGMNKVVGLKAMLHQVPSIDLSQCMYIGDSKNDVEIGNYILDAGGLFCVPGNAISELKQIASYVATHEFDEGVLEILERYKL
jgi:HAD superfamily hydrolase (TIGR01484 family)